MADYRARRHARALRRASSPSCGASPGSASTPRRPPSTRSAPAGRACRSAGRPGEAYYLPVRGPIHCRVLDPATMLDGLRPILADPAIEKVGQNIKYDMLALGTRRGGDRRADHRHHGPELPARERRAEPQPRPALPAAARPRDDPDHRPDRQGEEAGAGWTRSRWPRWPSTPARTPTRPGGSRRS